jgi:hypothetical protein
MNINFDGIDGKPDGYVMGNNIDEIDKKLKETGQQGFVYDPTGGLDNDEPVVNLVDVGDILGNVEKILEYMCRDEIIALKNQEDGEYGHHMEEQFPEFSFRYYTLFQTIINGEDLANLFSMLGAIERIKQGKISIEDAEKNLGNQLASQYVKNKTKQNKKKK